MVVLAPTVPLLGQTLTLLGQTLRVFAQTPPTNEHRTVAVSQTLPEDDTTSRSG